jgi:hypothetical protein
VIVLTCCLFITSVKSFSQSITTGNGKVEIGVGIGPLFFLGDLGGSRGLGRTFIKDIDYPLTKLNKGFYLNIAATDWLGFRIAGNWGTLEGDDKQAPDAGGEEQFRKLRNLNFKSILLEAYAATEFYPTVFFEQYDEMQGKLRPYGVIGIGIFHFDPMTKTDAGTWVHLQPLHTEGQGFAEFPDRKPYKLTQMEIPMGFGVKYYVKENMYIGFEVLHRKLFTDYVDDVSTRYIDPALFNNYLSASDAALARQLNYRGTFQFANTNPGAIVGEVRGDPKQNDAFFSTILRMGWRLNDNNNGERRQMRCPRFY